MPDDLRAALTAALRELVAGLGERAERAGPDPLRSVDFRLEEDRASEAWTLVVTHASGHGEESAHVLEDRVRIRLADEREAELEFSSLFDATDRRRVTWPEGDLSPLLDPVRDHLEDFLPPGIDGEP